MQQRLQWNASEIKKEFNVMSKNILIYEGQCHS